MFMVRCRDNFNFRFAAFGIEKSGQKSKELMWNHQREKIWKGLGGRNLSFQFLQKKLVEFHGILISLHWATISTFPPLPYLIYSMDFYYFLVRMLSEKKISNMHDFFFSSQFNVICMKWKEREKKNK